MFPSLNCRTTLQDPKRRISWRLLRIYRHVESRTNVGKKKKSTGSFQGRVNQQCFPLSVSNCSPGLVHCQHMHTPTAGYQSTDTTGRAGSTAFSNSEQDTHTAKAASMPSQFLFCKQSFFQLVQFQSRKANIKQNTCGKQIKKNQARDATMLHDD